MARYEHLTIFRNAIDLTVYIEQVVRNFSRYHKYTIGTRLREKSWDIVELIIKVNNNFFIYTVFRYPIDRLENLLAVVNSYLAHFAYANSFRLVQRILTGEGWIYEYLDFNNNKAIRLWQAPRYLRYLGSQWLWFKQRYPGSILMFRIGRFYEFYGQDAVFVGFVLGYTRLKPRFYGLPRCGVPVRMGDVTIKRLMKERVEIVIVEQTGDPLYHLKERSVYAHYIPDSGSKDVKSYKNGGER